MSCSPGQINRDSRLDELAEMKDGWYWRGEGKAPTALAIQMARNFPGLYSWHIYPTLEGGVSLEADADGFCWDVRIGPRGGLRILVVPVPSSCLFPDFSADGRPE